MSKKRRKKERKIRCMKYLYDIRWNRHETDYISTETDYISIKLHLITEMHLKHAEMFFFICENLWWFKMEFVETRRITDVEVSKWNEIRCQMDFLVLTRNHREMEVNPWNSVETNRMHWERTFCKYSFHWMTNWMCLTFFFHSHRM